MSIQVSDVLTEAYRKLGKPSQADMPFMDLIGVVRDVWRGLSLDLKMAARGHTVEMGNWVVPTQREMSTASFTGAGHIIPVKVEWRPDGSEDEVIGQKIDVVAFEQLNMDSPDIRVAFTGDFETIIFGDVYYDSREYRVSYEPLDDVDVDEADDLLPAPPLFVSYLADEAAVRALDYIDGNEAWAEKRERLRGILTLSLVENKMRFEKWKKTQFGNKKVSKHMKLIRRGYGC
jgi:hypothetical protein